MNYVPDKAYGSTICIFRVDFLRDLFKEGDKG